MTKVESLQEQGTEESPSPTRGRQIRISLARIGLVYLALVALLTVFQRSLIYHPRTESSLEASEAGLPLGTVHDFQFPATDGLSLNGWHFLRHNETARNAAECKRLLGQSELVLLFFQGNAGNRRYRTDEGRMLTECDVDVLMSDYRGFGDNPGSYSEAMLVSDAHALWAYAVHECGVPSDRIVLYGESLGGGVAVRLASELSQAGTPPAGLIVEASFSSLGDVAQDHFPYIPARWLLWDEFDSKSHIQEIACPYLHIHGSEDQTVPCAIGETLFAAAPPASPSGIAKQFVCIEGAGHNNLFHGSATEESMNAVREFLARLRED